MSHRIAGLTVRALLLSIIVTSAQGATTDFRVLLDVDRNTLTGCAVTGMSGVDQVFVTRVTSDATSARVTRTFRHACEGGTLGNAIEVESSGWPARFEAASGQVMAESRIPHSVLNTTTTPPQNIQVGVEAVQEAASHLVIAGPAGELVMLPVARSRRRSVAAPGLARVFLLDGLDPDWTALSPFIDGIAAGSTNGPRILRVFAFSSSTDDFIYLRFDALLFADSLVAIDDSYGRNPGSPLDVAAPGVLANDSHPHGLPLTAMTVSPAARGNVTLNPDGSFTYTPEDPASIEPDSFQYRAASGATMSNAARVTISVAVREVPIAADDMYNASEDTELTVPAPGVLGNDSSSDPLTATLLSAPLRGTVVLQADGGFTYTPAAEEFGVDSFTYTVSDGIGEDTATVAITIASENDPPSVMSANFAIAENSPNGTSIGTMGVTDADQEDTHTWSITSGNTGGAFAINSASGDITVADASALNFEVMPTFVLTVRAQDDGSPELSDLASATIDLSNVAEAPSFTSAPATTATEDTAYAYAVTTSDEDAGATLTVAATVRPSWLTFTDNGNGTASLSGTPVNADVGAHPVVIEVTDGTATAQQTFTVTVANVNDAPGFTSSPVTAATEDAPYSYSITTNDVDAGNIRTISAPTLPSWLVLTDNGDGTASLSGTPLNADVGANSVVLEVSDGAVTVQQSFAITVVNMNDAPAFTSAAVTSATEDAPYAYSVTASDVDAGDAITITAPTKPAWLTFTDNGNGTASLGGTPTNAEVGAHPVTLEVDDGDVTVQQNFTITVANTNDAPSFTSSPLTSATEDAAYTYAVTTSDVDSGDTITITAPTLPSWLTLTDNGDGTASLGGTPLNADVGAHNVVLQVNDGDGAVQQSFAITVANTNDAPAFTSTPVTAATEDSPYAYSITTTDVDAGDAVTVTAPTKPAWLTFTDNGNGTASLGGTPSNAEVGAHPVTLEVDDGDVTVQQNFTITVANTNDAPSFTSSPLTSATEDAAYTYAVTTSDVDSGDTITITAPTLPSWLTLTDNGDGTASLSGTPLNADVGANSVVLEVSDGAVTVQQSFAITVVNTNDAPAFTSAAGTSATEDTPYAYSVTATDVDAGDAIAITAPVRPSWLAFTDNGNGTASLGGTPTNAEVGAHPVTLEVDDGDVTVQQNFIITVANANDAPSFTSSPLTSATEDTAYTYAVITSDVDSGDTITITAPTLPSWLTLTDNGDGTASLSGTPLNADVGANSVVLEVSDGAVTVQQSFAITVVNTNDAPAFTSPPVTAAAEDAPYSYSVTTSDVDAGDTLTITAPTKPAWISFTDNGNGTASLSGTPTNADVGSHNVVLEVTDGDVVVQQSFSIAVANTNDAPLFTSTPITIATEDVVYTYGITTTDVDAGDTRSITAPALPSWLTLTDNGDGTASLGGTPLNADVGAHNVVLQVNDGDEAVQQSFTITVANTNDAPSFTSTPVTAATEDSPYAYSITITDADAGDAVTVTAPTKPAWLTFTDNGNGTASLGGTPTNAEVGAHPVTLEVDDGDVTVQQSFTITVANANDAPAFTSSPVSGATEDSPYSYSISTTDVDAGDTRTITAPTLPSWLTLVDNGDGSASVSGTPLNTDVGNHSVVLEANDGDAATQQSFSITVANTNDAPTFTSAPVTTASEDSPYVYSITTADVDAGDTRTITAPTKPVWISFTDNGDGTASMSGTPMNADVGPHNVVLDVNDGDVTVQQSFTVTVVNTNDPPVFTSAPVTTGAEDVAYTYNITTGDIDVGDTRTITAPTKPAWLTLTDNGNGTASLAGTPLDANIGVNAVVLEVNDGDVAVQQSFSITVSNTNDAPVANADTNAAVEDGGPVSGNVLTNDTDDDIADALTVSEVNGSGANVGSPLAATYGSVSIAGNGAYTYTIDNASPIVQALGVTSNVPEVFNYTTTDGTASASSTLTVTVTGANDPPTAIADTNTLTEDTTSVNGSVLTNDTDVDSVDTKTVTEVNGSGANVGTSVAGTYGSVNIAANGSYIYTLNTSDPIVQALSTGGTLNEIFNYTMADGGASTGGSTLTVTITGINDAPVFTSANTANVPENTTAVLTLTATDAEGATPVFTKTGGADQAKFTLAGDVLTFTTAPDFEAPTDADSNNVYIVQVTATDGTNPVNQTVTVTVTNVNEAPVNTFPGAQTTVEDTNKIFSSGGGNPISISDPDAGTNPVQVTLVAVNGTLSTNGVAGLTFTPANAGNDGVDDTTLVFTGTIANINARLNGLTFKPAANYYGSASVSILTNDQGNTGSGGAQSSNGGVANVIAVTVSPVNDPPTATAKTHVTHSAIGLTISAATHAGELKEGAADVDDHDPFSELTVQIVGGSAMPVGSTVTLVSASDGSFYYEPRGGMSGVGAGSFQFQVCDNGDVGLGLAAQCSTATTVTFDLTGPDLWFVDDTDAAGCGVSCNGSRTKPLVGINNAALAGRGSGDRIFAFAGTYNHGHTFAGGEHLIGQASSGSFDTRLGVSVPANGTLDTRPALSGAPVTLQNTVTGASNMVMSGLAITIGSGTSTGFTATGATLISVMECSVSSTGPAVALNNVSAHATNQMTFTGTRSTGGAHGISLVNLTAGVFSFGGGIAGTGLSGNTTAGFYAQDIGNAQITYSGAVAGARAVMIGVNATNSSGLEHASASVSLSGPLGGGGVALYESTAGTISLTNASQTFSTGNVDAVELIDNAGATVNFSGGSLSLTTVNGHGIDATGGGTVNITGNENTINTTGSGSALNWAMLSTGHSAGTLRFKTINKSGSGAKGLVVNYHDGSFAITGDDDDNGTPDSLTAGGTITGTSARGAEFIDVDGGVSLGGMTFTSTVSGDGTGPADCGNALMTAANKNCNAAIYFDTINAVSLRTLDVNGSLQTGVMGYDVTGLSMNGVTVRNGGDNIAENGGAAFKNLKGTVSVVNSSFRDNTRAQFDITNVAGTTAGNITFLNNEFTGNRAPNLSAQGLLIVNQGTMGVVAIGDGTVANDNSFHDTYSNGIQYAGSQGATSATLNINRNTFTNTNSAVVLQVAGVGTASTLDYDVRNNAIVAGALTTSGAIITSATQGHALDGLIQSNTIGTSGVANSGAVCNSCNGITVDHDGFGRHDVRIIGNTVQRVKSIAIYYQVVDASGNVEITGNLVREPEGNPANGIYVQNGSVSGNDGCVALTLGGLTNGGFPTTTAGAMNSVQGTWDPAGSQSEIFVWRRFSTVINLPGLSGAADAWIAARNNIPDSTGADVTVSGTPFGNAASCP